jgi:hypothetical protein
MYMVRALKEQPEPVGFLERVFASHAVPHALRHVVLAVLYS